MTQTNILGRTFYIQGSVGDEDLWYEKRGPIIALYFCSLRRCLVALVEIPLPGHTDPDDTGGRVPSALYEEHELTRKTMDDCDWQLGPPVPDTEEQDDATD